MFDSPILTQTKFWKYLFTLTLLGMGLVVFSLAHSQNFRHQIFSVTEGLGQSQVLSMCQDRRGYVWVGTWGGGVSRFDGRTFKTFTTEDGLLGNQVGAIAEDKNGTLWFACNQKGLCYYDGFHFHTVAEKPQIVFEDATSLYCGASGNVWIATEGEGLFCWNGKAIRNFTKADGLNSDSVYSFMPFDKDMLLVGTAAGISIVKNGTISPLSNQTFAHAPTQVVHAMAKVDDGNVIGSENGRLWYWEDHGFRYEDLPKSIGNISAIIEDKAGNKWLTGEHLAAYIDKYKVFHLLGLKNGLKDSNTKCLLNDANGNVWIGTDGAGAIRYSPEAFTLYGEETPFESRSVFSLLELSKGKMLVGTEKGLYTLENDEVLAVKDFPMPEAKVMTLVRDAQGDILVATLQGTWRWNGKTFREITVGDRSRPLSLAGITRMSNDEMLTSFEHGIYVLGADRAERKQLQGLHPRGTYAPYAEADGGLWLTSRRYGLLHWRDGDTIVYDAQHLLGSDQVFSFVTDRNGAHWCGTDDGLVRIIGDQVMHINTKDGLSGKLIYLLQLDALGNLWAGTENGLTCLKLDSHSNPIDIRTYGMAEGFVGIECNLNAATRDSMGRLWFGTIEGLTCYKPDQDIHDNRPPNVEITRFDVKLEKVDWEKRGFKVTPWTLVPIDAVLEAGEDHVRFEFAGITQHLGVKVKYRYFLEGLDADYSDPTTENYRVYSPLPPGDYTFKVIACNADNVWTKEPAMLHFTIKAPFWKTSWFAVLVFLAIVVSLLGIIRIRTGTLQRQRAVLEAKVKQRTEALEQANQVKGEFLAKMSHEIRTPMNGVIGMTDLLERTPLTPQQRKFVENIRVSGQSLLSLINDILDFSRIESGKMELEHIPMDLRQLMEEVMDILSFNAFSKGLELLYWVDPEIRGPVMGDPARLKQVLTNLVGNAVKFTSSGEITLRARLVSLDDDLAVIQCSVKDSGIGIPKEKHATLFESFTQVDASTTRKYGGTGLGLAISYNLSRMMGGEMWLESEIGQGSEFFFTIKVGTSGPWNYPGDAHPAKSLEGRKVVLAMKHAATLALLEEYMGHWGVQMQVAASVEEALDLALDDAEVSFLLIDLRLSHGDPSQFAQRIAGICNGKALNFGLMAEPDVAIPMQTLIGKHGWVLPKPLKRDDLLQALLGHKQDDDVQATIESQAFLATQVPLRILVAEDNPINQDVAIGMLSGLGYQIRIAENGREALEAALKGDVDLIFMDVQMPVMDGIEATKQIVAAMPRDKRPLIVAMTANAMESDRKRCIEAGMDTFISKPFLMNELVRMLKTVPAMRVGKLPDQADVSLELASEPTQDLPAPELPPSQPANPASEAPTKLTDMTMLEAVSNGEPAFVLGILSKLAIKLPEAVEELRAAIDKADWETVRATSHRNKSSAAYTGSDELKNKFMEMEHMARDLNHLEEMPIKIEELHQFVTAVVIELNAHIAQRTQ